MNSVSLDTDVQFLRGVGPDRARLLQKLGIRTVGDLLWHLPRAILDFSNLSPPHLLKADEPQSVRGRVIDMEIRSLPKNRTLTGVLIDAETEFVRGVWFNQPWMLKKFQTGQQVLFSGKPKRNQGRWEFAHPHVQWLDADDVPHGSELILTRYPLTEGITIQEMRRMARAAVEETAEQVADPLPAPLLSRLQMPRLGEALQKVHHPGSTEEFEQARKRLMFDDVFGFQLGVALRRRAWKVQRHAPVMERTAKIDARIRRLFPFPYTAGQNLAVQDIAADLRSGIAMHRLLQADVGAGKTVVAIDTMLTAVAAGWQAVMMAPTELLANQHWETIDEILRDSRVSRTLLTGSLSATARRDVIDRLASGDVQLVVGTQALIQKDVAYHRLGVVVIDEQHKFGVAQRSHFSQMGEHSPHVLVMTATPIPRTLCLTQFGDLDLTLVKDRPAGRQMVVTSKITGPEARKKAWSFLVEQLQSGRQLYIVCPLVDSGEETELGSTAAEQVFRELQQRELRNFRVGLVHGRMDRAARDEVMNRFRDRELDALVATTVVEVGVDVPNATLMVVLEAERFGLSQLHQLRGRVARGRFRGYCFLFSESDAPESLSRLAVLERTADGFEVAEQDFSLRGPGDILGSRQHGEMPVRFPQALRDDELLELARTEAAGLVESGEFDREDYAPLKQMVLARFTEMMDLPQGG